MDASGRIWLDDPLLTFLTFMSEEPVEATSIHRPGDAERRDRITRTASLALSAAMMGAGTAGGVYLAGDFVRWVNGTVAGGVGDVVDSAASVVGARTGVGAAVRRFFDSDGVRDVVTGTSVLSGLTATSLYVGGSFLLEATKYLVKESGIDDGATREEVVQNLIKGRRREDENPEAQDDRDLDPRGSDAELALIVLRNKDEANAPRPPMGEALGPTF